MTTDDDGRPAFPAQWSVLQIPIDELNLAHTLPVGQTFLWHREPVRREVDVQGMGCELGVETEGPLGEVAHVEHELQTLVKSEPTDAPLLLHSDPSSHESRDDIKPSHEPTEEWSRAIPDPARIIFLRQTPSKIFYTSITSSPTTPVNPTTDRAYLVDLFNLDVTAPHGTLGDVYGTWAEGDPLLFGKAWRTGGVPRGVRVLRQDPWECLLSFITSSANNVPRITSLMHRLSRHFSPALTTLPLPGNPTAKMETDVSSYTTYHLFPRPRDLLLRSADPLHPGETTTKMEQTLRDLGFGYRAGFISSSVRTLVLAHGTTEERALLGEAGDESGDVAGVEAFLGSLRDQGAPWRGELLALKGVGRKVADCVGLMSLDRHNIVPIDTHLQQIAARHPRFPAKLKSKATSTEGVYNAVQEFLRDLWGGHTLRDEAGTGMGLAGWCQSVMFAADLKGSTAVVAVKIETTVKEEVSVDGPEGGVVLGKRNGRRILERQVEGTASVVSDMLDAPLAPPTTTKSGKRKREVKPDTTLIRKMTSVKARVKVERTHISDMMGSSKRSLHTVDQRIKVEAGREDEVKGVSRRSERYSVRCDKLEVDVKSEDI